MTAISQETLEKLRRFDTPTICNAIELFDVRPYNAGFMDKCIRAVYPDLPPMVGFATTATQRAADPPRGGESYGSLAGQVERFGEIEGPPVVVLQDLDAPPLAAAFGEIMCTTYHAFGAVGLVTNGPGRDLAQVRALDMPVFTGGAVCSHGYFYLIDFNVPVYVGGLTVYPNDLLHGDLNGVTTVPREIAAELPDVAAAFVAAEQVILDAMHAESPSLKTLHEAIAASKAQVAQLRAQVSRAR
jgi:regulator of RNase E activity RraA